MTLHNNKKPLQGPCITAQPRTHSPTIKTAWEVPLAANYFSQSRRAAALLTKYSMRYKESPARTAPSLLTLRLPRHGADMAGKAGSIYWGSPHSASPGSAVRTIPARHILGWCEMPPRSRESSRAASSRRGQARFNEEGQRQYSSRQSLSSSSCVTCRGPPSLTASAGIKSRPGAAAEDLTLLFVASRRGKLQQEGWNAAKGRQRQPRNINVSCLWLSMSRLATNCAA